MVRLNCLLFEKTLARVLRACKNNSLFYWRNRCSTWRSCSKADQRLTRVSFSFVKKRFLWVIFWVIFKSTQSSTCWQNEAFTSEFKFCSNPPRLGYLNPALNNPAQVLLNSKREIFMSRARIELATRPIFIVFGGSQVRFSPRVREFSFSWASMVSLLFKLKMFTGGVCVLLNSVSLKLVKIKIKLIYATTSSWENNKGVKGKWRQLILFFFLLSELIFLWS